MIISRSHQTIRARSAIKEVATSLSTAPQGPTALIAGTAVHLSVPIGTGIQLTAGLAAARRGATRALHLRLAVKTWG